MLPCVLLGAACGLVGCGAEDKSASSDAAKTSAATAAASASPAPSVTADADAQDRPDKGDGTAGPNSLGPRDPGAPSRTPSQGGDEGIGGRKLAAIAELSAGTLDRDEVQRAIDASAGKLTPCLVNETRVRIQATITQTGDVAEATVLAADPDDPKLRDCVAAAFRRVAFPKPKGSSATTLTVDLVLRPELKL